MKNKFEVRKRLSIIIWVSVSSLIFWLISFLPDSFDSGSYLKYMFILFGGGFAFHFLTEMLRAPANEGNWDHWGELAIQLCLVVLTILLVFGVYYLEKHVFKFYGLLTFAAIIVAMWRIIGHANVAHDILSKINENDKR